MAVNNLVKRLQNIMRQDAGINGDAQRIEQMVWLIFLKIYDAKEEDWEIDDPDFVSIIPEPLRWRNWAPSKDADGKERNDILTGEGLLKFIDQTLFPVLKGEDSADGSIKGIHVSRTTPRGKAIVYDVFTEVNQYMKNGVLLRQMINVIDEIDLFDSEESHAFGDIYEGILKDLQNAGNAGEFYTPRALTDFIVQMLNPQLGEKVADFAGGTAGFLVSAIRHMVSQLDNIVDQDIDKAIAAFQGSFLGQEWKPFPYLLAVTNLLLHGIKNPEYYHMDSLSHPMSDYHDESSKVDVIAMNPPYGGATDASTKQNFKQQFRSSETADLFLVLIMERLAANGRAGVIVPDGFLFGTDGAKLAIKEKMLRDFNLHTIIRLPGSIFNPYTSIATNVLFFDRGRAKGAADGFSTFQTWFYRLDMPEGYKHFSKTKPMKVDHCQPIIDWWNNRSEIVNDEVGEKSRVFSAQQLLDLSCNFDQCKFPKEEEEVLPPDELLRQYHERRNALEMEIEERLTGVEKLIKGEEVQLREYAKRDPWKALAEINACLPEALKKSILQEAIQGKLVPQDPNDEPASVLLDKIRKEKEQLVKEGKLKKKDLVSEPISDDEKPFDLPEGWIFARLQEISIDSADGPFGSNLKKEHYTEKREVRIIQLSNIGELGWKDENVKYTTFKHLPSISRSEAYAGDVIIAKMMPAGRAIICPSHEQKFVLSSDAVRFNFPYYLDKKYLFYAINSSVVKKQVYGEVQGITRVRTSLNKLRTYIIPLPPLAEQHRIVAKIEQLMALIDNLNK